MKRSLALMALSGLVASNAFAGQIEKKDSWVLNEFDSEGRVVCEASTEDRGVVRHYTLKIQKAKNTHLPVEVFLHEKGKAEYGPIAIAKINNEVVLFNQSAIADKSQSFWYLPDETKLLLDLLRSSAKTFEVQAYGDSKGRDLKFNLKGAAHIIAAMEKRCNNSKALVDDRFSQLTNHQASFDQNPKVFDATSLSQIRAAYYELAEHYNQLQLREAELQKLTDANGPNLREREALKTERTELVNRKIPELKTNIQNTIARIEAGERRLVQLRTEIPAAERQRAAAQAKYDEAYKKIEPHLPKHNELVNQLVSAQNALSNAESSLATAERELSNNLTRIQQLDRDAQDLSYTISRLRSELPSAQSEADRRYREYSSFNADSEIRRRLNGSSKYLSLRSERERFEREIDRERDTLRSLERDLQRAKSQLGHCQSVPGQDCSSQQSAVNSAESQVSSKERDIQRLDSQLDSTRREMDRIENDIEREVRDIEDRLRRAYDEAAAKLSNLQTQLDRAEGERRDIVEYQIPRLKNRNIELRSMISDLESDIVAYEQSVKRAESDLARFDQSVGFSKLQQAVDTTEAALDSAKQNLAQLTSEDARLKSQVPQDKTKLAQLNETLRLSEQRLVQVNNRIAQLDRDLAGYDSQKSQLEDKMNTIKAQIKDVQSRYMRYFQ